MKKWMLLFVWFLHGIVVGAPLSQEVAVDQALRWMQSNPVMSKASPVIQSVEKFPNLGTDYSVYVMQLSPRGYLVLNSDDCLPLLVSFSADSSVDLTDDPQNTFRAMLLSYCARMEEELAQSKPAQSFPLAMADTPLSETELYGPFLETSWNQNNPYNLLCPAVSGGLNGYDNRAPVGCVPTAFAQVLNYHHWPYYGAGSRSYTDNSGSVTGLHSAVFSDAYDWKDMQVAHSPSDPQVTQDAVGELMYELGVAAGVNYEAGGTSGSVSTLGNRLADYFFFESIESYTTSIGMIASMEVDLRAGFPCIVSIPGHAVVADGLMVDDGVTTYHINYGWGGVNNGWFASSGIPGGGLDGGVTALRPELVAFPQTSAVSGAAGGSAEVRWILPKRRESEVSQLSIKRLEQQVGSWQSNASIIPTVNSGWSVVSAGHTGNGWFSGSNGPSSMVLDPIFVPDDSTQLTFWFSRRLGTATFSVEVSTNGGESYSTVFTNNNNYSLTWASRSVSLSTYAGQQVRLKFALSNGSYYPDGGIWLDDLAMTSGDWYDWEPFAVDSTLASRRFSEVTTEWDDCEDLDGFNVTSTSWDNKKWAVSNVTGVGNCFYIIPDGYGGTTDYITSKNTITPTSSTRLVLNAKFNLGSDVFRVLLSTNGSSYSEVWAGAGTVDWSDIAIDLSTYAEQPIYIRLEYVVGSFYTNGIWVNSISTQETTNPELEGQPVHYTTLTNLPAGTHTLAAVLTDTNAVEHALGPSFTLEVSANENDTDNDGLPNEWETLYFGGITNANPAAMASNGVNTVLEAYIAGLNPTNLASWFKITSFDPVTGGFVLRWSAVTGRVYSVSWQTNLQNGFQPLATNIVWPQSSYTDTVHNAESHNFYKINVQLAP